MQGKLLKGLGLCCWLRGTYLKWWFLDQLVLFVEGECQIQGWFPCRDVIIKAALSLRPTWAETPPCQPTLTTSVLSQGRGPCKYKYPKREPLKMQIHCVDPCKLKCESMNCRPNTNSKDAVSWKPKYTRPLEAWRKNGTLDRKILRLLVHGEDLLRFVSLIFLFR